MQAANQASKINDLVNQICETNALTSMFNSSNMNCVDAAIKETMAKTLFKLKEEYVKEVHKNQLTVGTFAQGGKLRYGIYTRVNGNKIRVSVKWDGEPLQPGTVIPELYDGLYFEIIEKLYETYNAVPADYSIGTILKQANQYWITMTNPQPETKRKAGYDYKKYVSDELKGTDIRVITKPMLMEYMTGIIIKLAMRPKALGSMLGVFHRIFDYALEQGYVTTDPTPRKKSELDALRKKCSQGTTKHQDEMFTHREVTAIRKSCRQKMVDNANLTVKMLAAAKLLATYTGMRVAEISALKWADIDAENSQLHIHAQLLVDSDQNNGIFYAPWTKNEKGISRGGRFIDITPPMQEIFSVLRKIHNENGIESPYLFSHADGTWITPKSIESSLEKECKKMGFKVMNIHAFRKYVNSWVLIPEGIPVANRAAFLGHSPEVNFRNYSLKISDLTDVQAARDTFYGRI